MTDRIVLDGMAFSGRHGVHDWEKVTPQRFEVDVELVLDLAPAGTSDDLTRTIDYGPVYRLVREIVEQRSFDLIETLAETVASAVLDAHRVDEVVVRVRKPDVRLGGPLRFAAVEISRRR
jgi:dihydroneopterin aldolase